MSDAERADLLNLLREMAVAHQGNNRRRSDRVDYRSHEVGLEINHPGGGVGRFLVYPREISAGGISLIHGGFVHPHSRCKVQLTTTNGKKRLVTGRVAWCNHLRGPHHIMGVQFDIPLDLKLFLDRKDWPASLVAAMVSDSAQLAGRVLCIDDQVMEHDLLSFHLRNSSLELHRALSGQEALDALKAHSFDLIICDLNLGAVSGESLIGDVRRAGFLGPIIALTSESTPERLEAAKAAGAAEIMSKPYDPVMLLNVIAECLKAVRSSEDNEPVYSDLSDQQGTARLIGTYLDRVKQTVREMVLALEKDDLKAVKRACQTLQATGAGYGFGSLTEAAGHAVAALEAASSIAQCKDELDRLQSLVRRLRVRTSPPSPAPPAMTAASASTAGAPPTPAADSSRPKAAAPTSQPAPPGATPKPPRG
jgi:CheY-like chemotaxis protein